MSIPHHHRRERAAPAEERADWSQSPWIGIALLVVVLLAAWLLSGAPAIVITGW